MADLGAIEHEQLVTDYLAVWNHGEYANLPDVVAEDVVIYEPSAPGGEIRGRDELESFLREMRAAFPDLYGAIDDALATDEFVMLEWTTTATHEGEYEGLPATGREIELSGMDKIAISDGKVQDHWVYYDPRPMREQLGLTFPEILGQLPKLAWRKLRGAP